MKDRTTAKYDFFERLKIFFFNFQHKSRHLKDVQIMTLEDSEDLDHSRGETFRREGGAEILELDQVNIRDGGSGVERGGGPTVGQIRQKCKETSNLM